MCLLSGLSLLYAITAMAKDYYSILGVQKGASADEIKKAYRQLSKEWHPDKHKGDKAAEQKFKEINQAYEVLSNPQKRQGYDQFGEAGAQGQPGGGAGFGGFSGFDFNGSTMDFGDLFEGFFGGGRAQRRSSDRGDDKEVTIQIEFSDVVLGIEKIISIRRLIACERCSGDGAEPGSKIVTCAECGGTGQITRTAQSFFGAVQQRMVCPRCKGSGKIPETPCKKCDGEGRILSSASVTVNVPAGIESGQTLRLRGQGDAGRRGSEAGDLYVHIDVKPDPRFERDGMDIRSEISVHVVDALLGTEASVDTVHGPVTLSIPAGTQPGQLFRMKGKGFPVLQSSQKGDHYVTVNVEIPQKLSKQERKIVEEWKNLK